MSALIPYALTLALTPYQWGGESPLTGLDCSGLVQELLRSVGMDPPGDQSAQDLYSYFIKNSLMVSKTDLGALIFFGTSVTSITHVAMALNEYQMIEAGGGGRDTLSPQIAAAHNAFVRIRPISNRKDMLAIVMPRYPFPL